MNLKLKATLKKYINIKWSLALRTLLRRWRQRRVAGVQHQPDSIWNKRVSHWIWGKTVSHEYSCVVEQAAQRIHAVSTRGGFQDPAGWLGSSWHLSEFKLSYDSMKGSSFTWSLCGKLKDILHQCQSFWSEAWLGVPVINISTECLGGYYNSGAVIHDSNADSTGQLLMCFVTSLVMTFIYKTANGNTMPEVSKHYLCFITF